MTSPESTPNHPSSIRDIESLLTPEGSLYASGDEAYQYMLFGRDSLEAADDLLESEPRLTMDVIDSLAKLQGTEYNEATAEETGKIPHQHMSLFVDGVRIPPKAEAQLRALGERWGGDENGFTYYGSLDATPQFARIMARFCFHHGASFLHEPIELENGERIARKESLRRSLRWISDHIESSELSLLEFRRLNDNHIVMQSWKDSGSAYVHTSGEQVNLDGFIAPVEVQGYGYDALKLGALSLKEIDYISDEEANLFFECAELLRDTTLERFWISDREGFAMAIDRDKSGNPRQVATPSSSQAALLDTRLLMDLDEGQRQQYTGAIIERLFSPDFITEIGLRCRSAEAADLVSFADYHGSWAVWPKETYDFAKGLWRHGFNKLADDLCNRVTNMTNVAGENYEFLFVNPNGDVDYEPKRYIPGMEVDEIIIATNVAEKCQAWTASAVLATKRKLRPQHGIAESAWSQQLEKSILEMVPREELLLRSEDIRSRRANARNFAIDIESGIKADKLWNPSWWT